MERLERAAVLSSQRYFVGRRMVRHMCATGLLSKPRPSSGCLKLRPTMSMNGLPAHDRVGVEGVDVVDGNHAAQSCTTCDPGRAYRLP